MCTATLGATPVYRFTCAASSIFSCTVRGTPGCANTLNRVPVLPNAQDGSSICWARRAVFTAVRSGISGHLQAADLGAVTGYALVQVENFVDPLEALVGLLAAEIGEVRCHAGLPAAVDAGLRHPLQRGRVVVGFQVAHQEAVAGQERSEERRVGKECRTRWVS